MSWCNPSRPPRASDIVKGFAVGRTIFNDAAAERWFKGEIDDEARVDALPNNLAGLVDAWRRAKKTRTR
jgi:5-dehydro-2-deoxygluconokinase